MQTLSGNLPILVEGVVASVHIEQTRFVNCGAVGNLRHCWLDRNEPPAAAAAVYKALQLHAEQLP